MPILRPYIYLVLFCFVTGNVLAQNNCSLKIVQADSATILTGVSLKTSFSSKPSCLKYVQQIPTLLAAAGYISASVDTVHEDSASVSVVLYNGRRYTWEYIVVAEKDWYVLNTLGFDSAAFHNKPFDNGKVQKMHELLLDYFANNGYPFARVGLDSITINNGRLTARLNINKGFLYHIDSVVVTGNAKLSANFLYHYLDIKPRDVYNQDKLDKINQRLLELPYVEQSEPWQLTMLNTGAVITVALNQRRSNQVNVLVGFAPSNQSIGGKLLLTGDATLDLRNPFGNGETISVNWQQLQSQSPRLNLLLQKPYIFNSSFGFNFNFELYKKDSSYLNINALAGVQYILSAHQSGAVYIQTNNTRVLNIDTSLVILTKQLPPDIDAGSVNLGLQYNFNNTNYRFNPRKGNDFQLTTSFGNKRIKKSSAVLQIKDPSFNYASLYDSLQPNTYQVKVRISAAHYFPLGKQSTFKAAANAGWYQSPDYFQNELFQIGGYRLLRGFDEESIYANRFAVGSAEYHYLLGQNSYLFAFTDAGWARYQTILTKFSHTYIGIGFGMAFETKTGVFNISFAEGKRNDGSFDFRQSKIHLGFVSVF